MYKMEYSENPDRSRYHYEKGYAWAKDAINRYGNEAAAGMRTRIGEPGSSYERGVCDALDGKASRYETK